MFSAFGLPSAPQIHSLTQAVWMGDDDARYILADAYDEIGRYDIAALWRDALPSYRRRKRVEKLTSAEIAAIKVNKTWVETEVMHRTGPSDEALALAAIGCLYRANLRHRALDVRYLEYPRVTWLPSPAVVKRNTLNGVGNRREELGEIIWFSRRTWERQLSNSVRSILLDIAYFSARFEHAVERAGEDEDLALSGGIWLGQFDTHLLQIAAIIDVLRLIQGPEELYPDNNELSVRALLALIRCTSFCYTFEKACILAPHPFTIDADQPRWAWLDSENRSYQWPTTR